MRPLREPRATAKFFWTAVVEQERCIGCGLCSERAPENLEMADDTRTAKVIKQPETPEEEQACLDASEYCPMGGLHAGPADA